MKGWRTAIVLMIAGTGVASTASAQDPYTPYRPATPTISPWLNMFRRDPGPLDNYHTFVQPRIQAQQTLRQQEAAIQRNQAAIGSVNEQLTQIEAQRETSIRPTGSASTFMNYSHYYGGRGATGQPPPKATSGRQSWSPPPAKSYARMPTVGR